MPEKIFVGNFAKGLTQDRLPFVIDNDAFPVLVNAYTWRGRVKRKRGTELIGRLQIQFSTMGTIVLNGAGVGNLLTGFGISAGSTLVPGTINVTVNAINYTDPTKDGFLTPTGTGGPNTINYVTGVITIPAGAGLALTGAFNYFPNLPVMGLEDFYSGNNQYPLLLAFDTKYSYQINQATANLFFYNVSYYKSTGLPVTWTGTDYDQFWSCNYEGAFWATNGVPGFNISKGISAITQPDGTHLTITVANVAAIGDYIFVWEVVETVVLGQLMLNGVSGKVTAASGAAITILVPTGTYNAYVSGGIIQYLTRSLGTGDGIRWYDGDPTGGSGLAPSGTTGWVNFSPPVSLGPFGFDNLNVQEYYLVGAIAILPFKDRLLFFGPYIQSSNDTMPTQLLDTVLWSWNGTPYYAQPTPKTSSGNQYGYDPTAYQVNVTGKGGYLSAGIAQEIVTINNNEDVLLIGFTGRQTRFVYTGNDLFPFLFYNINSELGSSATFSGVTLDRGALTIGQYGLALTSQTSAQRIDLVIPDLIFNVAATNNGVQRVNAARDFYREWIYFTYPYDGSNWKYPTQTLIYNYRDNTWGLFYENYTHHGAFRFITNDLTWATVGSVYPTWESWNQPWNSSTTDVDFPSVCAGNQQGFVMNLDQGIAEGPSQQITAIATLNPEVLTITSPNHCLMEDDYVQLQNILGSPDLNGLIGSVGIIETAGVVDANNFTWDFGAAHGFTGVYNGGGVYARLSQPFIQTKQFPPFWNDGRQVRLGVQKYLLDNTTAGQITLNIYLSQDPDDPWNNGPIVPSIGSVNNSLVYGQTIFTTPENDRETVTNQSIGNLGNGVLLTILVDLDGILDIQAGIVPGTVFISVGAVATFTDNGNGTFTATGTGISAGSMIDYQVGTATLVFSVAPNLLPSTASLQYYLSNIQNPISPAQYQIWHRINTSLIGNTVQLGFTLSDAQMRNIVQATSEIALHAFVIDVSPGPHLA